MNSNILCKYLNIYEFLDLFINQRLFFTKPKNYSDINDSKISNKGIKEINDNLEFILKYYNLLETACDNYISKGNILNNIENFYKNTTYTACFSILNEYDTKYMWENYAFNGVMIKTSIDKLKKSIVNLSEKNSKDSLLVLMDYVKYEDNVNNTDHCIFSKNKKFSVEREYRIAITNYKLANNQCSPKGKIYYLNQNISNPNNMYVNINPHILIEKIVISPYLKKWESDILNSIMQKYCYKFKIEKSSLKLKL